MVFDGAEETKIDLHGNAARLSLGGHSIQFSIDEPPGVQLIRRGKRLDFRNGEAERVFGEIHGQRAIYSIRSSQ